MSLYKPKTVSKARKMLEGQYGRGKVEYLREVR